jgi:hypothetical protein
VRSQVLTAASIKFRIVFWDVLPCKIIFDRRFRGTWLIGQPSPLDSYIRVTAVLSRLMMEVARTSETSVHNYFTRQYIPEDNSELRYTFVPHCHISEFRHCSVIGSQTMHRGTQAESDNPRDIIWPVGIVDGITNRKGGGRCPLKSGNKVIVVRYELYPHCSEACWTQLWAGRPGSLLVGTTCQIDFGAHIAFCPASTEEFLLG